MTPEKNLKISTFRVGLAVLVLLLSNAVCDAAFSPVFQDSTTIQGTPRITHYTKKEFNSDSQFWAMCQDKDGVLYFANNDGAVIFDGEQWQTVKLPNGSSIRSLKVSEEGI